MKRKIRFCLAIATIPPAPAVAQDDPSQGQCQGDDCIVIADTVRDTYITVVASGTDQTIVSTGQSISVVGGEEIAAVQGADMVRVLERLPGVTASRNGGLGSFTGVRVRGAEAEQLLVTVDGVRMADPGSPGAGFDFGMLLPYGVGKIELLRGSNSTVWGSQAMGGVLAVTSAERDGVEGSAEYGAHDTVAGSLVAGTGWSGGSATLDAALVDTDGFSAAAAGTEPDGFRQWQVGGRAWQAVTGWLSLDAAGRFAEGRLDIDGFPPPDFTFADTPEYQKTRQASGRAGARLYWQDLTIDGSYSLAHTRREQFDPALGSEPGYTTEGRSELAQARGNWGVTDAVAMRFGGEREWTRFESTFDSPKRAATTAAYAQLGYDDERLSANAGVRLDDHSDFGSEWSFGADARLRLGEGWSAHASYGEGFKAPSLFQLFSDYGNDALQPERSRSFDLGIGIGDRNASPYVDVTLFRRDTRDLIGFVGCFGQTAGICEDRPFGTYDNIGKARAQGVEVEGGVRPLEDLGLSAAYAYVEATDRTPGSATEGNDLARRPRHALTISGEWQAVDAVTLAADVRVVSKSFDDAANAVEMDGYEVLTLRANWDVDEHVALFGRVENVWDEHYETAAGYATEGRAAHVGARARF